MAEVAAGERRDAGGVRKRPELHPLIGPLIGRLVCALLSLVLLAGVLTQLPWATLGAVLGRGPATYDEEALATTSEHAAPIDDAPSATVSPRPSGPLTLRVAAWGRSFRVVDVGLGDDGALVPPHDVSTVGRWDGGALPGDGTGAVVLVVHRDSATQGRGPFAELEDLAVGARVTLDGRPYLLQSVETYRKDGLPAEEVFGQDRPERLVIVTCGGSYSSTRGWDSNVVATFRPAET